MGEVRALSLGRKWEIELAGPDLRCCTLCWWGVDPHRVPGRGALAAPLGSKGERSRRWLGACQGATVLRPGPGTSLCVCRVPSPPLLSLCPWARFKTAGRLCPVPGCAPDTPKQQGLTWPDSEQREGWAACKDCVRFLFGKVRCCLGHARKEGEFCHVKSNLHVLAHSSAFCPAQNGEGEERGKKTKQNKKSPHFPVLILCPG